ncbi:ABC transporter ATP-binding protein [Angustibacter luteus]|uniref:ABC transporter ATP-binding protein n=1 Tax=Angustibacter luteus TaxID=658456 RepID=A0ABW1JEV0_9ACTN
MALLEVTNLSVDYAPRDVAVVHAVRDVSFSIDEGEFIGLLGESGSGKSTLGTAILRLTERPGAITSGSIVFDGTDITEADDVALQPLRWQQMSTVFQSSMNSLNPVMKIEAQFRDVIEMHTDLRGDAVTERAAELLELVSIERRFLRFYPHELSGGMKQRVAIALALCLDPKLVILDEPTTGLDVIVQRSILDNLRRLQAERGFAVLFISHDIGTVLEAADRVMVMYAGQLVEQQPAGSMLRDPMHPYSKGMLGSYADPRAETVRITYIPGRPPSLTRPPTACPFAPRCPEAIALCHEQDPELLPLAGGEVACHVAQAQRSPSATEEPVRGFTGPVFVKSAADLVDEIDEDVVLTVDDVCKTYSARRGGTPVQAVDHVSFSLRRGRVTALVGQSGSGKTTLARMITAVERPDSGAVTFGEQRIDKLGRRAATAYRRHVQMVFQDPFSALNPNRTLGYALSRPLRNYRGLSGQELRTEVLNLLETVGLTPAEEYAAKLPHQLSGGQRQRVVVARALAPNPQIIVADEPISMLDVSIRAEVLELLDSLVRDRDLAVLYITHDLLSARMLADEVLVLHEGHLVEQGPALTVIREARDDYTRQLLEAIPNPFKDLPDHSANGSGSAEPDGGPRRKDTVTEGA